MSCVNALSRAMLISTQQVLTADTEQKTCVNALSRAMLISTAEREKEWRQTKRCQCP